MQQRPRYAAPPRARLLACFALAFAAHVAAIALRPGPMRFVESRRSAGGLLQIEFDEPAHHVSYHPAPLHAATVLAAPAARPHRAAVIAPRLPTLAQARDDDALHSLGSKTTSSVVGSLPSDVTSSTGSRVVEAGAPASTGAGDRAVVSHEHSAQGRPHGPRLLTADACSGLFPPRARDDDGAVIVALGVHESGAPYAARVISESPPRQGFGGAALRCASSLKFAPAESAAGARVSSISVVRLRFARARTQ